MKKQNCWEFKKCGRQPGGDKAEESGVCIAAIFEKADGFCGGTNGGRACTFVDGTLCTGEIHGTFIDKMKDCVNCDFFKQLYEEHYREFTPVGFAKHVKKNI